jgi:hypothetical protein
MVIKAEHESNRKVKGATKANKISFFLRNKVKSDFIWLRLDIHGSQKKLIENKTGNNFGLGYSQFLPNGLKFSQIIKARPPKAPRPLAAKTL